MISHKQLGPAGRTFQNSTYNMNMRNAHRHLQCNVHGISHTEHERISAASQLGPAFLAGKTLQGGFQSLHSRGSAQDVPGLGNLAVRVLLPLPGKGLPEAQLYNHAPRVGLLQRLQHGGLGSRHQLIAWHHLINQSHLHMRRVGLAQHTAGPRVGIELQAHQDHVISLLQIAQLQSWGSMLLLQTIAAIVVRKHKTSTLRASCGGSRVAFMHRCSAFLLPITRAINRPQYSGTEMPMATSFSPMWPCRETSECYLLSSRAW